MFTYLIQPSPRVRGWFYVYNHYGAHLYTGTWEECRGYVTEHFQLMSIMMRGVPPND